MNQRFCKNCIYFDQAIDDNGKYLDYGRCRRHAPVSWKEKYPVQTEDDICGEFVINDWK